MEGGETKIFSQVKTCPLGLNGICYIHGIIVCYKKAKEHEVTGCSVKKSAMKHQCRDGWRHVMEEAKLNSSIFIYVKWIKRLSVM